MTEGFNFDEINKKFIEISDALDSIKTQNALNIGDTSRVLNTLTTKLDTVFGSRDEEEMLDLIADLKHSISDKYSYITVKFTELETAIKEITNDNNDLITTPQMKELFDVLSTNLTVFSKQVMAQGDILNEITLRIEALRTDDTDKREIIKNINSIKSDLEKFNNGFESIILNVNNNFENLAEMISKLDPTAEVTNMLESLTSVKSTSDAIMTAVQIVDQKQNKINEIIDEVISQNTKINANVKALAGQSDFDGLVRKVEGSIELITTLKSVLTDVSEQSQRALLIQLDKLSSIVPKILTEEDFELFKAELTKLVYDVVETTNVMRGDLINTSSEFQALVKLLENQDIKTSFDGLKDFVTKTSQDIKEDFVEVVVNNGIEPIKNSLTSLFENLEQVKTSFVENNNKNSEEFSLKLNSLTDLSQNIREIVNNLPNIIREKYAVSEEELKNLTAHYMKDLPEVLNNINNLKREVENISSPVKEALLPEIVKLKVLVDEIKNLLSNNEGIASKITNLESTVGRIAGDFDMALHSIQQNLMNYLSDIKENCESADIKMNNFAFEFNSLKSELSKVFADYKDAAKSQNDKFNSVCNGLSSRFDLIMNAVTNVIEQPAAISGIKEGFDEVQHTMQDLMLAIADIKVQMSSNIIKATTTSENPEPPILDDSILKLESKLNKIKDQMNFMSTDIMENLYNNSEKLFEEIEPIKKAVLSFVNVDFQNVASILKDQMDAYKIGMEKLMDESLTDEARPILNNIFTGFGSLENRVNNMENALKESLANSLEDIKNLVEQTKPFIRRVENSTIGTKNTSSFDGSIEDLTEHLDAIIVDFRNNLNDKFQNIHKHLDDCVIPKIDEVKTTQDTILSKIDNSQNKEDFSTIKNQLNELFDKISAIHHDIISEKATPNSNIISEGAFSNLEEAEKTILVDFTNNLSELANLVKHTSDNLDTKITRNFAENNIQVGLESLKSDIEQMLSKVQINSSNNNIQIDDNSQNIQNVLKEYKSEIVNEIESLKQTLTEIKPDNELSNDLKVINQKMDLMTLNNDVKFEIDKSLEEIKSTVKEQQKFLNTVNILEALATLEDINNLKGIELLSKLSDIISVDKLNALNKLTLLDKLKNLECLNDLQQIPKLSGMIDLQEQLKVVVTGLDQKLNIFSKNYSTLDVFTEDVKNELNSFKNELNSAKTTIMKHVLNVFEQLSFVVEGEEIKDFVDEKSQNIIETIKTIENNLQNNGDITQEVKTIKHAIDSINPITYKDVENDFKELKESSNQSIQKFDAFSEKLETINQQLSQQINQLRVGSNEDNGEYTYSMQEVESDIAHLRLALADIKNVVEANSLKEIAEYVNEIVRQVDSMKFNISQDDIFKMKMDIERITSDVVSISSRTNKLLLASDESANALNTSMQSFRNTISDLYDGLKKLDYSEMTTALDTVKTQLADCLKQQNNTVTTVAKLSVWADSADEKISDVSEILNKLKKSMPSNENILDELDTKFAKQQQRIDALEEKMDELISIQSDSDTSNLSKKLADIDKQLNRLNRSIEKLTSYVDEE